MRSPLALTVVLIVLFQLCFVAAGQAQNVQNDKVTLGLNDESLEVAIKKIERQSAFRFFYHEADIAPVEHLNLPLATRTLAQTLDTLLQNTPIAYKQLDKNILLERKPRQPAYHLHGRVLNDSDKTPLPDASVFLSSATIGGRTASDGTFTLSNVTPGKYNLVISMVGFRPITKSVTVDTADMNLPDITISPKAVVLGEVKVRSLPASERQKYFNWFKAEFLGTSELAAECKILNPDALNLDYNYFTGTLSASSQEFLQIENKALGYYIRYLLTNFTMDSMNTIDKDIHYEGLVQVEEMKGTPQEEKRWQKLRQQVYEGSSLQFMRAVVNNKISQRGFRVLRLSKFANRQRPADSLITARIKFFTGSTARTDSLVFWQKKAKLPKTIEKLIPFPLYRDDIIKATDQPGLLALGFGETEDALYIDYNKNHHYYSNSRPVHLYDTLNKESTRINFNAPYALVDRNGAVFNPNSLTFIGVWGRSRLAEFLPINYEPQYGEANEPADNDTVRKKTAEKVYLQFDRLAYTPGDTVCFKAYIVSADERRLSNAGDELHVELVDTDKKIAWSAKLRADSGVASGRLVLPQVEDRFTLNAYTKSASGDSTGNVFSKVISESAADAAGYGQQAKDNVRFFPEGGNLVAGIRSKIAFKATGVNGLGANVSGIIADDRNFEVARFSSVHLGMGYFYLTPEAGHTYQAKLIYGDGSQSIIALPRASSSGMVLSVDNDSIPKATVAITANEAYFTENRGKDYTVLIYSGGLVSSFTCRLDERVVTLNILKRRRPTGITTVTVFSPDGEPLCERLFFIQNYDELNINISSNKAVYARGEKVNIKLNAINRAGIPAEGNFSASVMKESGDPDESYNNIVSDLLLTSGLKEYVQQPGYYLNDTSATARKDLDVLMLTQCYLCFNWKKQQPENGSRVFNSMYNLTEVGNLLLTADKDSRQACRAAICWKPRLTTGKDGSASFEYNNPTAAGNYQVIVEGVDDKGNIGRQVYHYKVE